MRLGVCSLLWVLAVCAVPRVCGAAGVVGDGTSASCTESALDAALDGGGTVTFNCGAPTTITVTATKTITEDTVIDGGGLVTLSGGDAVRLILVMPNTNLVLTKTTITEGYGDLAAGGAIRNLGTLTVQRSTLSDSFSTTVGGAIGNEGDCTIIESTLIDNRSEFAGGGIANFRTLLIRGSTLFRNVAGPSGVVTYGLGGRGGGVANYGTFDVINSTFSSNVSLPFDGTIPPLLGSGGAIDNQGVARVVNCTLSRNRATFFGYCGALANGSDLLTVQNTLIVGSEGLDCCSDVPLTAESTSNLYDGSIASTCSTFNQVSPESLNLKGLTDNGGPTLTVAVEPGSVAIDAGNVAVCRDASTVGGADQLGSERFSVTDLFCDIGAVEAQRGPMPTPAATFLHLKGQTGDFVTLGMELTLTPREGRFVADYNFGQVTVQFDGRPPHAAWHVAFAAPAGMELRPGDYDSKKQWPFQLPNDPGLRISGDGRSCGQGTGTFSVRESSYAIDGTVEKFAADFEQYCDDSLGGGLYGSIRVKSNAPTAGVPTRQPTATLPPPDPTPTRTIPRCESDCNDNGRVTIDELVTGVTIALGRAALSRCPTIDSDENTIVSINEVVRAVNHALFGCRIL